MPRRVRLTVPGISWHIIQRDNNSVGCIYAEEVSVICHATTGDFVFGSDRFETKSERMLMRRIVPGKSGRPAATER